MTWRDDLRRVTIDKRQLVGASFRGVPFLVETTEQNGGRRAVVHEFPLRDEPFVEDMGRRARTFRIDGYVIGDTYLEKRDALLTALEDTAGPGELVHPYRGGNRVIRAICVECHVRETRADGGMATFSLEFVETPAQAAVPTSVVDAAAQIAASAGAAIAATTAEFVSAYEPQGLPSFALDSAETALVNATQKLSAQLAPIVTASQELAEFTGRVALLTAQAKSLVRQPAEVLGKFRDSFIGLAETISVAPGAVMDGLLEAYLEELGVEVVATTATRARERENQGAITSALRRILAVEAARLAPVVEYASAEEATAARDRVAAVLDEQAGLADDTAYTSIVTLRSDILRLVPGSRAFASVVTVTRRSQVPSLLLAYQLYGSVELEADVVARNSIRHPGFIAGDVKVLVNE